MAKRFGEYLVQQGLIHETQLAQALERQVTIGGRLGTNLVELGFISEQALTQALSRHLKMAPAPPEVFDKITDDVLKQLPRELVQRHGAVPFTREGRTLCVAMADPSELAALDELTFAAGCAVKPFVAPEAKVQEALEKYYDLARPLRYVTVMAGMGGATLYNDGQIIEEMEQTLPTIENFEHGIKQSYDELLHVKHRDEVAAVLLREFARVVEHALFFTVVEERLIGLMGRGGDFDYNAFVGMEFPWAQSPLLTQAIETREPAIQLYAEDALGPAMTTLLRNYQPRQIAAYPLEAAGRVIGVLYADRQQASGAFPYVDLLQKFMSKGGMAVEMLVLKKKILEL
jgi:GAF domain-containing protein